MTDYGQARSPERVWKYEWAIIQAAGDSDELADFSSEAEAAMTLADAEIADFRVEIKNAYMIATVLHRELELSRREAARLRAELAEMTADRDSWKDTFYEQG